MDTESTRIWRLNVTGVRDPKSTCVYKDPVWDASTHLHHLFEVSHTEETLHNVTMRCLLLSLAVILSCICGGCLSEDVSVVRELGGHIQPKEGEFRAPHLSWGKGGHIQPKEGEFRAPHLSWGKGGHVQPKEDGLPCGDYTMSAGNVAVIKSKNYPSNYPNRHNCYWTFETTDDSTLSFSCQDFKLRLSSQCRGDFLHITDFASTNEKYCGSEVDSLSGMEGYVQIRFKTNRRGTERGFSCTITASSADTEVTNEGNTSTEASSQTTTETSSSPCNCGKRNTVSRIVGGETTTTHEYPWQVALVSKSGSRPYCGGSVISAQWILTAAHCVDRNTASGSDVVVGEHDWSTSGETSATKRLSIAQVISHPSYSSSTYDNDIALLKLAQPLTFQNDNKVAPVCLPTPGELYEAVDATITGWGTLASGGSQPNKLNEVTVPTMTNAACKATGYDNNEITANMICAGLSQGGKDSCQGDSGGPMVAGSGNMQQIGIVSWGYGCAAAGYPGVYTRVSNYVSWIQSNTAGSQTCRSA
ncbi:ovochymase-1-like [Eriocheir sinensis]|uniref:ovochymase-1-like n=1 Tax=Eriocheir sinensis TaxID=95602 RepID=UPI0021CA37A6|nr:ovochymase-1-like [Eriocheir sinensis]